MLVPSTVRGKRIPEDLNRSLDWVSTPEGNSLAAPVSGSTDIVCHACRNPWGGLVYNAETDVFVHRDPIECSPYRKGFSER